MSYIFELSFDNALLLLSTYSLSNVEGNIQSLITYSLLYLWKIESGSKTHFQAEKQKRKGNVQLYCELSGESAADSETQSSGVRRF